MTREEVTNSSSYQTTTEAVNRYKTNKRLHIESFVEGADYGYELAVKKACEWLLKNIHNYLLVTGGGYWFDEGVVLDLRKAIEQ